ncbi:hypothetical protein HN011_007725, partial [Eciton burchellii]
RDFKLQSNPEHDDGKHDDDDDDDDDDNGKHDDDNDNDDNDDDDDDGKENENDGDDDDDHDDDDDDDDEDRHDDDVVPHSPEYLVKYRRKEEKRRESVVERELRGSRGASCPRLALAGTTKRATLKGNGGFGDYSAAGEFEVWGDEHHAADGGLERGQVARPPSRQQRCEGGSSLRPLLHVAHCELHSPREAELLRLDHLEGLDHKSVEHDAYTMMDNFHSPVPPPLPRRHVRARASSAELEQPGLLEAVAVAVINVGDLRLSPCFAQRPPPTPSTGDGANTYRD